MLTIPGDNKRTAAFFKQSDFSGGMRRNVDPSRLGEDEYAFLSNGRIRYGNIRTIKLPSDLTTTLPAGQYQGLYGYGKFLIAFISGKAYVRDYSVPNNQFQLLEGFQLSQDVDTIYAEAVEASWMNQMRKAVTEGQTNGPVNLFSNVAGTPSCLVCQDGTNRPLLIFPSGQVRQAHNFGQWQNTDDVNSDMREYVPIGKQMLNFDGVLYIVSADGSQIYRSVTGRFLDFVVAIDLEGNKLPPLANDTEEAARLSYRVDFNAITCIAGLPSTPIDPTQGAGFFVGTSQASYIVFPNYVDTLFGEATFSKQILFETGPLNQFSVADILGDNAIIDAAGMVSFNAVLQLRNEGKNAPFHDDIHDLFTGITQTVTAAYNFDNYALFGVDTIYGPGMLVYDTMRRKYVSLDIYPAVTGYISQFAEVKVAGIHKLFFRTTGNQLFEAYASQTTATVSLYTREMMVDNIAEVEHIPKRLRVTLQDVVENGTLTATEYVDRKAGTSRPVTIEATASEPTMPLVPPFGATSDVDTTQVKSIPFELTRKGDKCGLWLQWNCKCDFRKLTLVTEADQSFVSQQQQGADYVTQKGS